MEVLTQLDLLPEGKPQNDEWSTPLWLFSRLHHEFEFTVDVCAKPWNAKVDYYFTPAHNGLLRPWLGAAWMNPPYARTIMAEWIRTAVYNADRFDTTVVGLLPVRSCTDYWHEYVMRASELRFVHGRLRFEGPPGGVIDRTGRRRRTLEPPWSSVVVVWRGRNRPATPLVGSIHR